MERYRLAELTQLTGLTPRTIRFYIQEGLLPPPKGLGRAAVYTGEHRDRLRLIERLKGQYLPLREIRRQLAALTAEQVREEVRREERAAFAPPAAAIREGTATSHLDRGLRRGAEAPPAAARMLSRLPGVPARPRGAARDAPPSRARWERIALGEGVELHVREDRLGEAGPLEALIRQARKLLGEE